MLYSNYEVIEILIRIDTGDMEYSASSPDEWLEQVMEDSGTTAWTAFAEDNSLEDFDNLDDLTCAFEDYAASFMEEAWDRVEIESAVESEIDTVWESKTMYMDSEEKLEALRNM